MSPVALMAVGAVSIAATAPIMGMFLPPVYEVRAGQVEVKHQELRHSMAMGGGIALAIGVAASVGTGSSAPIIGAMIGVACIAGIYEYALKG